MYHILRYKFSIITSLAIFYVSILKPAQMPTVPLFTGTDKLIHLLMYFVLGLVLNWDTSSASVSSSTQQLKISKQLLVFALPILYGGIIELLQANFFPPRTGEWLDFGANVAGVLLAYLTYHKIFKKYLNRK